MKLYNLTPSSFSSRVRMQIYAKDLDVEIENISWPPGADYKRRTGTGKVPALEVNGHMLIESTAIGEYLEDLGKGPALRPTDPFERAQMRILVQINDQYLSPDIAVVIRQFLSQSNDQSVIQPALTRLKSHLALLEGRIGGGRYAFGSSLSLADCALVPTLLYTQILSNMYGLAEPLRDVPKIARYYDAIATEPAAAKVLAEMQAAFS